MFMNYIMLLLCCYLNHIASSYLRLLQLQITGDAIDVTDHRRRRRTKRLTTTTPSGRATTATAATRHQQRRRRSGHRHPATMLLLLLVPAHRVVRRQLRSRRHRCDGRGPLAARTSGRMKHGRAIRFRVTAHFDAVRIRLRITRMQASLGAAVLRCRLLWLVVMVRMVL